MGHTFISYAREDREKVAGLASALEAVGLSVWLDDRLVAGSHFDTAIEQALAEAASVVVVWSPASVQSRWVRAEAGEGLERGILVPVLLEPTSIPIEFKRVHAVDLMTWAGDPGDHAFLPLVAALKRETSAAPRPASDRATRIHRVGTDQVTAEIVHVNEAKAAMKIVVRLGVESVTVEHKISGLAQELIVDDKAVYDSMWRFKENHRFPLTFRGRQRLGELTLYRGRAGLKGFSLRVDGVEILREHFSLREYFASSLIPMIVGAVGWIGIISLIFVFFEPKKHFTETQFAIALALAAFALPFLVPFTVQVAKHWTRGRKS